VNRAAVHLLLTLILLSSGTGDAATAHSTGGAAHSSASRTRAPAPTRGPTDPEVASFVKLMNAHRVSLGLSPLIWDNRVAAVAEAHSRDMYRRQYFSHTSRDGRSTWDRLAARGVTFSEAGENIAWGQRTGRAVLTGWLGSPGHRENIERGSYTHHGVGKVGTYWTHVFIRPRRAPPSRARIKPLRRDHSSRE
jgi:uncharacterized protein YkwD